MIYVTTPDVSGLTADEYRKVLDEAGVEVHPAANIYLHLTSEIPGGFRILEIWDSQEAFRDFLKERFGPAHRALKLNRKMSITVTPLHNCFGPRIQELLETVATPPGSLNHQLV